MGTSGRRNMRYLILDKLGETMYPRGGKEKVTGRSGEHKRIERRIQNKQEDISGSTIVALEENAGRWVRLKWNTLNSRNRENIGNTLGLHNPPRKETSAFKKNSCETARPLIGAAGTARKADKPVKWTSRLRQGDEWGASAEK